MHVLLDRTPKTIRVCLKTYQAGGLQAVYQYAKHKHECKLDAHAVSIEKELETQPPQSANEARARIEKLTGIKRSVTQISDLIWRDSKGKQSVTASRMK